MIIRLVYNCVLVVFCCVLAGCGGLLAGFVILWHLWLCFVYRLIVALFSGACVGCEFVIVVMVTCAFLGGLILGW